MAENADRLLDADDLHLLTKRTRYKAMCRVLAIMKIPFRPRPDGFPLVMLSAAAAYTGSPFKTVKPAEKFVMNLEALNDGKKAKPASRDAA